LLRPDSAARKNLLRRKLLLHKLPRHKPQAIRTISFAKLPERL
jgi:hypothetical protein